MSTYVKELMMDQLRADLDGSRSVLILDLKGIDGVAENQLRLDLRKKSIKLRALKNTLARRVFEEMGLGGLSQYLEGPSVAVWGGDGVAELRMSPHPSGRDPQVEPLDTPVQVHRQVCQRNQHSVVAQLGGGAPAEVDDQEAQQDRRPVIARKPVEPSTGKDRHEQVDGNEHGEHNGELGEPPAVIGPLEDLPPGLRAVGRRGDHRGRHRHRGRRRTDCCKSCRVA